MASIKRLMSQKRGIEFLPYYKVCADWDTNWLARLPEILLTEAKLSNQCTRDRSPVAAPVMYSEKLDGSSLVMSSGAISNNPEYTFVAGNAKVNVSGDTRDIINEYPAFTYAAIATQAIKKIVNQQAVLHPVYLKLEVLYTSLPNATIYPNITDSDAYVYILPMSRAYGANRKIIQALINTSPCTVELDIPVPDDNLNIIHRPAEIRVHFCLVPEYKFYTKPMINRLANTCFSDTPETAKYVIDKFDALKTPIRRRKYTLVPPPQPQTKEATSQLTSYLSSTILSLVRYHTNAICPEGIVVSRQGTRLTKLVNSEFLECRKIVWQHRKQLSCNTSKEKLRTRTAPIKQQVKNDILAILDAPVNHELLTYEKVTKSLCPSEFSDTQQRAILQLLSDAIDDIHKLEQTDAKFDYLSALQKINANFQQIHVDEIRKKNRLASAILKGIFSKMQSQVQSCKSITKLLAIIK